jgi:hypothetical protein
LLRKHFFFFLISTKKSFTIQNENLKPNEKDKIKELFKETFFYGAVLATKNDPTQVTLPQISGGDRAAQRIWRRRCTFINNKRLCFPP